MGSGGRRAMLLLLADCMGLLMLPGEVLLDPSGCWPRCWSGGGEDIVKVDEKHFSSISGGQDLSEILDRHACDITQVGVCCNCGTERAV